GAGDDEAADAAVGRRTIRRRDRGYRRAGAAMMPAARRLPPSAFGPMRRTKAVRLNPLPAVVICLAALLIQTALPLYVPQAGAWDFVVLAVASAAWSRRAPLVGMGIGVIVGLAQDGLPAGPIGLFGILKTSAGYAAGAIGAYIEIKFP